MNYQQYIKGSLGKRYKKWLNEGQIGHKRKQVAKIPTVTQFLLFSAPFSFWLLTCSSEFGLDFLCLSRLNDFGIVSLQKLQNLP